MHRFLLAGSSTFLFSTSLLGAAPTDPHQWGFDRRVDGAKDAVDVSGLIDSACSRSSKKSLGGFELEVKYPDACESAAQQIAEKLAESLDALARTRASTAMSPPRLQVLILPAQSLPSNFTYLHRSSIPTIGTLAIVPSCGPEVSVAESRRSDVASALLHEVVHASRVVDAYRERKAEWAREGAAEYLALVALRSSAPEFVASQMRERRPLELLASLPARKRQSILEGKHRGGKDEVGLSEVDRYTLYLAVFLEAERQGLVPLAPNSDPSGRRPPILGAPLKVVLAGMHRSEAAR